METWSFLDPWCTHLRGRVTLETRRSDPNSMRSSYSWLCVPLPPDGKGANWRRIEELREAVELLGAVARVDNRAFRELLAFKCGVSALHGSASGGTFGGGASVPLEEQALAPRFSFVFYQYANLDISWGSTLYNQFFLALDYETLSDKFHDAMAQVERMEMPRRGGCVDHSLVPKILVEITFKPPELPSHWSVPYLKSVLEVVQAIRDESECSTSGGDHPFPFYLESVCLNINYVTLSKKTMGILRDLLALGVKIPLLSLHDSTAIAKSPRDYMGEFITAMTRCPVQNATTTTTDAIGVESTPNQTLPPDSPVSGDTLRLRGPGVDSQQFGAFCSALASSKSIKSVHLSEMFTEERGYHRFIKWQWAAYAFFWRDSLSDISSLRIDDTKLRDDDVRAIASIVNAKYPAKKLLRVDMSESENGNGGDDDNEEEDPASDEPKDLERDNGEQDVVSVLLNKGTRINIDPYDPYEPRSFELGADDHFLVMKDDSSSGFVEILVPGYAHCAVARDAVQYYLCNSEADLSLDLPSQLAVNAGITSLHAEFKHVVAGSTLQAFIALVGAPLLSLVLKARAMSSETLDVILRTCTKLKRLSLDIIEESTLSVLAQAYESPNGCEISSLSLQGLELESEEVTKFAQALGNKDTTLAKTLEELSIGERLESYALDEANLFALLGMLETNAKIEFIELYVEHTLYDNFVPLFNEFHGQELPVMKEQMPLTCRLAFLSVLTTATVDMQPKEEDGNDDEDDTSGERALKRPRCQSSTSSTSADTSRLDRHVVALIFQFAAIPKQRVVNISKFH